MKLHGIHGCHGSYSTIKALVLVPLKVSWHSRETFESTTKAFATMTTLKVDTKTSGIDNDNAADSCITSKG